MERSEEVFARSKQLSGRHPTLIGTKNIVCRVNSCFVALALTYCSSDIGISVITDDLDLALMSTLDTQ